MRDDVNKQFSTCCVSIIISVSVVIFHYPSKEYIILENLTSRFVNPCIMDLKLGTRTHRDDMTEEKKQVHVTKCDTTTSKSLAIRLAGLQVIIIII